MESKSDYVFVVVLSSFMRGERIQIPLKVGHHGLALNGVSLAGDDGPALSAGVVAL